MAIFGNVTPANFFSCTNVQDWILANILKEDRSCTLFATMLWYTWKCRNKLVFDGTDETLHLTRIVCSTTNYFWHSREVLRSGLYAANPVSPSGSSEWIAPPMDWFKLNIDAISKGNLGMARGGGLIQDDKGDFRGGFTFLCGFCGALTAELRALAYGLEFAIKMGVSKLLVESDSFQAISLLKAESNPTHPDSFLIDRCCTLLKDGNRDFKASWIKRSANSVADALANYSLVVNLPYHDFLVSPSCIFSLLSSEVAVPLGQT